MEITSVKWQKFFTSSQKDGKVGGWRDLTDGLLLPCCARVVNNNRENFRFCWFTLGTSEKLVTEGQWSSKGNVLIDTI